MWEWVSGENKEAGTREKEDALGAFDRLGVGVAGYSKHFVVILSFRKVKQLTVSTDIPRTTKSGRRKKEKEKNAPSPSTA